MEQPDDRRQIINDIFTLSGQKVDEDDPVVALAVLLKRLHLVLAEDMAAQSKTMTAALENLSHSLTLREKNHRLTESSRKEIQDYIKTAVGKIQQKESHSSGLGWVNTLLLCCVCAFGVARFSLQNTCRLEATPNTYGSESSFTSSINQRRTRF